MANTGQKAPYPKTGILITAALIVVVLLATFFINAYKPLERRAIKQMMNY